MHQLDHGHSYIFCVDSRHDALRNLHTSPGIPAVSRQFLKSAIPSTGDFLKVGSTVPVQMEVKLVMVTLLKILLAFPVSLENRVGSASLV